MMPDAGAVHEDGLLDEVVITFPTDNDAKKRKRKPVVKHNENHDNLGRFSSGAGGSKVTAHGTVRVTPVKGSPADFADTRMAHQAPTNDGYNAPMWKADDGIYPSDVYGSNAAHLYGDGSKEHQSVAAVMRAVRGKPDAKVIVFRAVNPLDNGTMPKAELRPGDWVTPSLAYAKQHVDSNGEPGKSIIVEAEVPAKHLYTDGNYLPEWGYDPTPNSAIQKFNQNHDQNGRFSTGAGGATKVQLSAEHASDMTPEVRARIGEGLAAIGAVIKQTPAIKDITIHVQSPMDMPDGNGSILGFYNPVKKGTVTLNSHSDVETLVHEYAHMLDWEQLGGKGAGSASGGMHLPRDSKLSALGKAITASPESKKTYGQRGTFMEQYVTHHQEVFARAFSQYVATKSGNKKLLDVIHADTTQWSDENFKPISAAMEGYLGSKGLLAISLSQKTNSV